MKILLENWKHYLIENKVDKSNTLFFIKSPWGMKKNKWDHVGFVLTDGRMKDMSGHRGRDTDQTVEPIISSWNQMLSDDVFWEGWPNDKQKPQSPEEAQKLGIYKTIKLNKIIDVPNEIVCRTSDPSKKSENCGSFVFNVLHNAGIDASFLKRDEYIVVGKEF